jgi:uncharacterized repeat protein (TIGR02543 family)
MILLATAPEVIACGPPSVTTTAVSAITDTTAASGGNVTSSYTAVTARGVCWNTTGNPTIADSKTSDGTGIGVFVSDVTGLTSGTTYYLRAYATNSCTTAYGSQVSFTTSGTASTVITSAISSITGTTATGGGSVLSSYSPVTARGVCWNTTGSPTTASSKTIDGSGLGSFVSSLTGLTSSTTYYVRAYATSTDGTVYGNQVSFTTLAVAPTVATTAISSITTTTATGGGNVYYSVSPVTARGVCWNTTGSPTTASSKTIDGSGLGYFVSSLTGLTSSTTYYVRAYATSTDGTVYGSQVSFTTLSVAPTVTTAAVSGITTTSATCGGNVTGGASVTARGVCWNTTGSPTTASSKTVDGTGLGAFVSSLTSLTPGITYYVRAYATNAGGTVYGSQRTFSTIAVHTVTFVPGAHGTLTGVVSQTVAHGGDCTAATAVPDLGYHFTGWTGDYVGSDNPLTITAVTQDLTVMAGFAIDAHTVTFAAGEHGSLTGITSQIVDYGGSSAAVTAVPDPGYQFDNWTDSGVFFATYNPLTIDNVTCDLSIIANFVAVPVLDVAVTTTSDPSNAGSPVVAGDLLSVGVGVENVGGGVATSVRVSLSLPDNVEFVSAAVSGGDGARVQPAQVSVEGSRLTIEVGDIPAAGQVQVELMLRAKSGGSARFSARVLSEEAPEGVETPFSEVTIEDAYYLVFRRSSSCGVIGMLPLLALGTVPGLIRRFRRW